MLRPACLLPAARLSPHNGLSTPRLGPEALASRLGPATRRSGAYRGGTCTRWTTAAWTVPPYVSGRPVTTHHEGSLSLGSAVRHVRRLLDLDASSASGRSRPDVHRPSHGLSHPIRRPACGGATV